MRTEGFHAVADLLARAVSGDLDRLAQQGLVARRVQHHALLRVEQHHAKFVLVRQLDELGADDLRRPSGLLQVACALGNRAEKESDPLLGGDVLLLAQQQHET